MKFVNFHFKKNYNDNQLGSNENKVNRINQYLKKLKLNFTIRETIINYLSYQPEDSINCALYLDILSKSLSYIETMELSDLLPIVKNVHDVYQNITDLRLINFINLTPDEVIDKLYVGDYKHSFETEELQQYLNNLRFTAAINLDNKQYKNLFNSLSGNITYSAHYIFTLYKKLRKNLDKEPLVFFDIYFANEYLIELHKVNINIGEISKRKGKTNYSNYFAHK